MGILARKTDKLIDDTVDKTQDRFWERNQEKIKIGAAIAGAFAFGLLISKKNDITIVNVVETPKETT